MKNTFATYRATNFSLDWAHGFMTRDSSIITFALLANIIGLCPYFTMLPENNYICKDRKINTDFHILQACAEIVCWCVVSEKQQKIIMLRQLVQCLTAAAFISIKFYFLFLSLSVKRLSFQILDVARQRN